MKPLLFALLLALSAAVPVVAQEAEEIVVGGKVTSVAAGSITIMNELSKKPETYKTSLETTVKRGRTDTDSSEIKVGEGVMLRIKGSAVISVGLAPRD